ncbi:hypothetical protein V3565_04805 [Bartonella sp. B10]
MVKMFKRNMFLCVSTVVVCSFLQVVGANAHFGEGEFQHALSTVSVVEQEDANAMGVAVLGTLNQQVEKQAVTTEGVEKVNVSGKSVTSNSVFSAFSHKNFSSFFRSLFSDIMRYFSKVAKMI